MQLNKRVRASKGSDDEPEEFPTQRRASGPAQGRSRPSDVRHMDRDESAEEEDGSDGGDSDGSDNTDESSDESAAEPTAAISFGALAKAQAQLERQKTGGRKAESEDGDETWQNKEAEERQLGKKKSATHRTNKHAPLEQSSKRAVTRKREVIPVIVPHARDPRFEPLSGPVDESKFKKAYSFLDDYKEDEMKEMRATIRKTKDEWEKERLKKQLLSMESRKKADENKRRAEEVIRRHRQEEKELVKQGKQPFYLKKAELQKRVVLEKYGELKGKKLDHVLERRRKKLEQREKKKVPWARRGAEE